MAGSIATMSNCLSVSVNRPICRDRVAMVAGKPRSGGTWVSGPICIRTSLPTKTFAFASTVVRSELTIACDATNTASASDAATRNSVASLDDDARRRTARYHAETRDASPPRRRISATATTRAATIATPSANSNGNRKAADAGRSIVVPVTPPPERRCRTITYAPASARTSHGRNITSRASPARGSCFDAKANAVTVPISAMTATVARSDPTNAEDRADGSTIPAGPSHAIMAVATRNPATAPTIDGSADSSIALIPIRPGPQPRAASTPASTRRELNEKSPAAATTPNAITRAAMNSTWIGPWTAASRWSTMRTTPVIAPSNSVIVP